jgi:peroxiredoxin
LPPTPYGGYLRFSTLAGRWRLIVLVITGAPRDLVPFDRLREGFREEGARVLGVVAMDVARLRRAVESLGIKVTVVSDPGGQVASAYGVARRLGPILRVSTSTFIVEDGVVEETIAGVAPLRQALAALDYVRRRG